MVIENIVTKDPSVLDDDEHEWFDLIAKTSSMDKFGRLKSHLDVKEKVNKIIKVVGVQENQSKENRKCLYI